MTKDQFIQKWSVEPEEYSAMEFDLVSVIAQAEDEELQKQMRKYEKLNEEREEQIELERKAYKMTSEDIKKYIKNISFGQARGA